jgi:hypothetical protein
MTLSRLQRPVPLAAPKGGKWTSTRAVKGDLTISYRLPLENVPPVAGGPPINLRIDGDGLSAEGIALVAQPNLKGPYRIALHWDLSAMARARQGRVQLWRRRMSSCPPARPTAWPHRADGRHDQARRPRPVLGGLDRPPPFDPVPAMAWTAQLHSWMSKFFQDKTEPPYRVFMRLNPMNAGGGAAYPHSFLITWGKGVTGESIKSILGHEMTHTWTANDLGKWYDEGNAVFYQELLPWRAGLITTDQYLRRDQQDRQPLLHQPDDNTPEDQVVPRFWEDTRIRVLPYDRGAMYIAVLNGKIKRASGGKRSIDDLIKVMIARDHADQPITEAIWLDMLRAEIGEDGPDGPQGDAGRRSDAAGVRRLRTVLPPHDQEDPPLRPGLRPQLDRLARQDHQGPEAGWRSRQGRPARRRQDRLRRSHGRGAGRCEPHPDLPGHARRQDLPPDLPAARRSRRRLPVGARPRRSPKARLQAVSGKSPMTLTRLIAGLLATVIAHRRSGAGAAAAPSSAPRTSRRTS